ncbi:unnamed protein product [Parnassius apollo]|uniref:(apollo) hypothetical protein n=1 Tax=Parnassius apollo TaxID=110799 RepID=A0A8S3XZI3_PARAO|nr:unnamed protein product [Parnassius apollo]
MEKPMYEYEKLKVFKMYKTVKDSLNVEFLQVYSYGNKRPALYREPNPSSLLVLRPSLALHLLGVATVAFISQ